MFEVSFTQASRLNSFFLLFSALLRLVQWSEKAMAPHPSIFAWKIPWTEEPGRLQSMGSLRVGHKWATSLSLSRIGEANGNPLHCFCLEKPRDGGAWWAAVSGVAQSWPQLKWLSSSSSKEEVVPLITSARLHDKFLSVFSICKMLTTGNAALTV